MTNQPNLPDFEPNGQKPCSTEFAGKPELDGFVTAKSVRDHNVDARRFCASDGWLVSLGNGRWARGSVPAFDQQHPDAYAQVLAEAKAKRRAVAA